VLVDNPDLAPQGCGEPAITTIGAALANAISMRWELAYIPCL
jgi:CO/xanthine dehydrogenase Mo-binding subunit